MIRIRPLELPNLKTGEQGLFAMHEQVAPGVYVGLRCEPGYLNTARRYIEGKSYHTLPWVQLGQEDRWPLWPNDFQVDAPMVESNSYAAEEIVHGKSQNAQETENAQGQEAQPIRGHDGEEGREADVKKEEEKVDAS